mgnify:CR=1 FL=1
MNIFWENNNKIHYFFHTFFAFFHFLIYEICQAFLYIYFRISDFSGFEIIYSILLEKWLVYEYYEKIIKQKYLYIKNVNILYVFHFYYFYILYFSQKFFHFFNFVDFLFNFFLIFKKYLLAKIFFFYFFNFLFLFSVFRKFFVPLNFKIFIFFLIHFWCKKQIKNS